MRGAPFKFDPIHPIKLYPGEELRIVYQMKRPGRDPVDFGSFDLPTGTGERSITNIEISADLNPMPFDDNEAIDAD
jgi:hypothetical protein